MLSIDLSKKVKGVQWGFYNESKDVQGVQFGVINVTETITGIQIGFVNIIKQGRLPVMIIANVYF